MSPPANQSIQIRDDTPDSLAAHNLTLGSGPGDAIAYRININSVSVESSVLSLSWAAVIAALILAVVWKFAVLTARRESEAKLATDKERLSRGERYVEHGL